MIYKSDPTWLRQEIRSVKIADEAGVVVVVVVRPSLPRDRGTARTAIQVHAVNLIELG